MNYSKYYKKHVLKEDVDKSSVVKELIGWFNQYDKDGILLLKKDDANDNKINLIVREDEFIDVEDPFKSLDIIKNVNTAELINVLTNHVDGIEEIKKLTFDNLYDNGTIYIDWEEETPE